LEGFTLGLPICDNEILVDPIHKMVLEHTFDYLMQKIRGDHRVDVGTWKICSKWLVKVSDNVCEQMKYETYTTISSSIPYSFHMDLELRISTRPAVNAVLHRPA